METSGTGATEDGWMDETFYLLMPSNYDDLPTTPARAPSPLITLTNPIQVMPMCMVIANTWISVGRSTWTVTWSICLTLPMFGYGR